MRAPGHPQASFAMESLLDELAYKIGMDPVEFRRKNMRDEAYHRQIDRGAREINWAKRNPTPGGGAGPLKRGMGCAAGTRGGGGNDQCQVDVTISRDGSVVVAVGTQDLGTGTRTFTRAIVAEELGLQSLCVHGVACAEDEDDVENGKVRPVKLLQIEDGGLPLNRLSMESQINGGVIQALDIAVFESLVMDADLGVQLNPFLMDYKL